jgi:endo-1,4-beta-xylanase
MDERAFYQENMYGIWRSGESLTYERLGADPEEEKPASSAPNPFVPVGGERIRICLSVGERGASFIVHAYLPDREARTAFEKRHEGCETFEASGRGLPFLICMHPILPKEYLLEQGIALFFMDSGEVASDDTKHSGAFYELYPYGEDPATQTGVLMAWAWGASKVLDAVYAGLGRELGLDPKASMVTGVSRWGKATAVCGAFDGRIRLTIPACSGAGGLALYKYSSEGCVYDFRKAGGPPRYTYGQNEPLSCLQSEAERGWFVDRFLQYHSPEEIPVDQSALPVLAMAADRAYFIIAAYTGEDWVNAPAMWEAYKQAASVYEENGLGDHLALHFHLVGHAVLQEDAERFLPYFDRMYYGLCPDLDLDLLKTTLFEGQEALEYDPDKYSP